MQKQAKGRKASKTAKKRPQTFFQAMFLLAVPHYYETALRDKFVRMEARDEVGSFESNVLVIFTSEPQRIQAIVNKIWADGFETSYPKLAALMGRGSLIFVLECNDNVCELINEYAVLTDKTMSGQISAKKMDELLEDLSHRILARIKSGNNDRPQTTNASSLSTPPPRMGSFRAVSNLTDIMMEDMGKKMGGRLVNTKRESYQHQPFIKTVNSDGTSFASFTLKLFPHINHEKAFEATFAKMEAFPDMKLVRRYRLVVFTEDFDAVNELLLRMTQQDNFAVRFPFVADAVRNKCFTYILLPSSALASLPSERIEALSEEELDALQEKLNSKPHPGITSSVTVMSRPLPSTGPGRCCASCGRESRTLLMCSACKVAFYCSPAHQKADWRYHKAQCKKLSAAAKTSDEQAI